ncbi:MAG: phenylalanine--tRNA ligase subunit beta [Holophagales bacterium]|jgi:phenylalanyl-tRNA synthetase beta chain|nr:phenylalanine--tRNA ligase subunit beta [Holophagales bacterium]
MLIELGALQTEISAIKGMSIAELCECLSMIGFPIDGVSTQHGSTILDVDVPANRGDALSHRGLARDIAAKLGSRLPNLAVPSVPVKKTNGGLATIPIVLEADACPLYAAALLSIDCGKDGQTPKSAEDFLAAVGSSAKRLAPVDASNEILHRYGHPTHAFDADKLSGGICVRWAKLGETLVTLDGALLNLDSKDMVIADESGPIALAGVIGGDATKVTGGTKRVLLESAYFDPAAVRSSARRHGLQTDASLRFGRGADIAFAEAARDIFASRLISWAGAEPVAFWTTRATVSRKSDGRDSILMPNLLERIAGEPIQPGEAGNILLRLGCKVEPAQGGLKVQPPTWRHDLSIAEDYAEEILRIKGYGSIGAALPLQGGAPGSMPEMFQLKLAISRRLTHLGFYQVVTHGFVGPSVDAGFTKSDAEGRTLLNPLGADYSVMRGSLMPSLRDIAEANLRNGARDVRLFEIAPVFDSGPDGPIETATLGLVWGGTIGGEDPLTPCRPVVVADLMAAASDIGLSGEPTISELCHQVFGMEIPMSAFQGEPEKIIPTFQPFSRHPAVTRDLSLLAPLGLSYGAVEKAMCVALESSPVQSVRCVNVFKDKKLIEEGKQAWLVRIRFQAMDRNLTGAEVENWVNAAIEAARACGAALRG